MKKVVILDSVNYSRSHEDEFLQEPLDEYIESPMEAQSNYEMFLKLEKEKQEKNDE